MLCSNGLLPACFNVGTFDAETLLVPVVVEFYSLRDLHGVDNAVAQVRWPEADYVIALVSSAALRNSSGVGKGIDKSVVQSGRDFPYIRVGGGQ